ncbi:reverse transcriptase domain-containing protein, partial [Tanacetum coccineum]
RSSQFYKGKRYKRRKSSKESASTGLDFEEVKSAFEEINAGSLDVNTSSNPVTTDSIRVSVPSPDREDWDTIRAKLEANAELKESVLGKDLTVEDYAKRNKPMTQTQLRNYMSNFLKNQGTWKLTQLKKLNFEEVKAEFEKLVKQLDTYVPMNFEAIKEADNRTMAQLLEAPTEGYEDAIVISEITANNFEIKHGLLNLVQNKQFFRNDKDPHAHVRYFNKITSTMKFPNVPSTSVKLMLFPFSLESAARIWLEKEPPRSILTWDDLVSKFINKFFPLSKTTNLRNEITRFQQRFDETFYEAWERFNDLIWACPHHGFSELHQLNTFYNALNSNDQDSLNSVAGGNFLDKMPRDCLRIIERKSKVHNSCNKPVVSKVSSSSSTPGISPDVAELKDMVKALLLDKKKQP